MSKDIAWAAGVFEGEGSLYVRTRNDRKGLYSRAEIAMTDADVVERFQTAIGFGSLGGPFGPYQKGTKPVFKWTVSGFEKTQALVAMFWPYLGQRRRAQARKALQIADPT